MTTPAPRPSQPADPMLDLGKIKLPESPLEGNATAHATSLRAATEKILHLQGQVLSLMRELEAAKKVNAYLPMTRDGASVSIGDNVWHPTWGRLRVDYDELPKTGGVRGYLAVGADDDNDLVYGVKIEECESAPPSSQPQGGGE